MVGTAPRAPLPTLPTIGCITKANRPLCVCHRTGYHCCRGVLRDAELPTVSTNAKTLKEPDMRHPDFVPQGVIPAVLLPFHEDLSIDEASFRSHLRDVGSVQGLSAITINAHS